MGHVTPGTLALQRFNPVPRNLIAEVEGFKPPRPGVNET